MQRDISYQQEQILKKYKIALEEITHPRNQDINIEVETRIGTLLDRSTGQFLPGVKREEFYCLKNYIESLPYFTENMSEECTKEKIFKQGRDNYRKVYDGQTNQFIKWERKSRGKPENFIITNEHDYCIRLMSSKEEDVSDDMADRIERDTEIYSTRHKWRKIYKINKYYMLHMTRVIQEMVKNGIKEQKKSYEIELEFISDEIVELDNDPIQIRECIRNYLGEMNFILDIIKKSHGNYFDDVIQYDKKELKIPYQLGRFVVDTIEGAGTYSRNFPGAMPVNFGRMSFEEIQKKEYIISEKTDGVRHFVLITESQVYLVTRSMEFYIVDYPGLIEIIGKKGISLFDAEIVRNIQTMRPVLMLFDAMVVDGMNCTKLKYSERLNKIYEIVDRVKTYEEQEYQENDDFITPFDIITKKFYKKEEIKKLFDMISYNTEINSYIIQDELRYHRSDGIIFAPDIEYLPFANQG